MAQRLREEASNTDGGIDPGGLEPAGDLVGIEAYAPSPADVGDAALVDQAPDVPVGDAEVLGQGVDVDEAREAGGRSITLLAAARFHTAPTCMKPPRSRWRSSSALAKFLRRR